ncbi:hypothetical protein JCM10212_002058 [Sporobolomyces blumeae]
MDTYLDPSLGGPLAFLDPSAQLHPAADPSNPPLNAFDYDAWLDPVAAPSYDAPQPLSVAHGPAPPAPMSLDARGALSSAHFGVHLHPEPAVASRINSAPLSPLAASVDSSTAMHLSFSAPDYGEGIFHPRSAGLTSQGFVHASTPPMVPAPVSGHSEPGTESMSIAMYDRQVGSSSRDQLSEYPTSLAAVPPSVEPLSPSTPGHIHQGPSRPTSQSRQIAYSLQQSSLRGNRHSPPSTRSRGPKTPQADESVPEAALHLLRLALPTGSAASTATNTTGDDEDRSCDEDAEGESDDTSIHSTDLKALSKLFPDGVGLHAQPPPFETTVWNHSEGQPPLHVQRGGGPGSRRPSIASSAASTRIRQHNPARAQREASIASNRSRAGSETPSTSGCYAGHASTPQGPAPGPAGAVGRRASARSRKSILPSQSEDAEALEGEDVGDRDAYDDDDDETDSGKGKKKKPAKGTTVAKGKGKATKRASSAADTPPPAKKSRGAAGKATPAAAGPRKPRRQAYIPPNLTNRHFPPEVEINPAFPRFYRTFPISSAISSESYVLKMPLPASANRSVARAGPSSASQSSQGELLPTPPTPIYDHFAFGSGTHSPYSAQSPTVPSPTSTMPAPLSNISVDGNGSFLLNEPAHHAHSHAHPHVHQFYQPAYSLPPHTPNSQAMSPPPLPQHSPAPSTISQASASSTAQSLVPGIPLMSVPSDAKWNKAGDPFNLYYPRFVKGNADEKCGMCPICAEPPERGGEGEQKWLKLKNSSYVYHMSYAHGLSNVTGLPFSPPVRLRTVDLPQTSKDTRAQMTEGLCHKCDAWIPLLSVKNIDAIVPELIWWKHAKKCHGESTILGERDPFVVDDLYNFVLARKNEVTY